MNTGERLALEHQHVDMLLHRVWLALRGDDSREVQLTWRQLETELDGHMRYEETELFPRFAEMHPTEAAALRAEHDELRRLMEALAIETELHTVRAEIAERLLDRLRAHAVREDALLHPWATRHLGDAATARKLAVAVTEGG